jgi:hypothetical protein
MTHDHQGSDSLASQPASSGQPQQEHAVARPPDLSPEQLALALRQVERGKAKRKLGRRALLVAAGATLCAGSVAVAPIAMRQVGQITEAEVKKAFESGIQAGRQQLLNELTALEGIPLTAAIDVAGLTKFAVDSIVAPLARLAVTITGDALQVLTNAVVSARRNLARINVTIGPLDSIQTLLTTWHDNLPDPKKLQSYADADLTGAQTYLIALKTKIESEQTGSPTPTSTATP